MVTSTVAAAAFAVSALGCGGCGGRGDADHPAPASDEWNLGTGAQVGSVVIEGGGSVTFGSFSDTLRLGGVVASARDREDGFVLLSAGHGEAGWLRAIGGAGVDQVTAAATTPDPGDRDHADVVVAGFVANAIELGGVRVGGRGQPDGYVVRLAGGDGRPRWVVALSASAWVVPRAVTIDRASGAIVVTGLFGGTLEVGGRTLIEPGGGAAFAARFDAGGRLLALRGEIRPR